MVEMFNHPTINALVEYLGQKERTKDSLQQSDEMVECPRMGKNRLKQLSQRRQLTKGHP